MHTNPIINTDNYVKLITFHRYTVHDNVINYFCKKIHYAENKCSVGYETIFSSPDKLSRLYGYFFFLISSTSNACIDCYRPICSRDKKYFVGRFKI